MQCMKINDGYVYGIKVSNIHKTKKNKSPNNNVSKKKSKKKSD